jgi:hypothetical protein
MKLTDVTVKGTKPAPKLFRLADGGGLYLEVTPLGSKLWRYRYRFNGKQKTLAIGVYPEFFPDTEGTAGSNSHFYTVKPIYLSLSTRFLLDKIASGSISPRLLKT